MSRVLSRHNIKSVTLFLRKISSFLQSVKDDLRLETLGMSVARSTLDRGGHSIDTRLKEHQRHISLEHPDILAMEEHSINLGHHIQLHHTTILSTKSRYMLSLSGR
jgi:hypothetical protein